MPYDGRSPRSVQELGRFRAREGGGRSGEPRRPVPGGQRVEHWTGELGGVVVERDVVPVHADDARAMVPRLFGRHLREGGEDHEITGLIQVCRCAVDAHGARASRTLERVGAQARPAGHVPDVDLLVGEDLRTIHQIPIDGDAAFVVEVGVGDGGAVDLRLEQAKFHGCCPLSSTWRPLGGGPPGRLCWWIPSTWAPALGAIELPRTSPRRCPTVVTQKGPSGCPDDRAGFASGPYICHERGAYARSIACRCSPCRSLGTRAGNLSPIHQRDAGASRRQRSSGGGTPSPRFGGNGPIHRGPSTGTAPV